MKSQYQNASNISARIRLHQEYSTNPQGWFSWIYDQCEIGKCQDILELGCGNGALWTENKEKLPDNIRIVLSDISDGMIRDVRRNIGMEDSRFSFLTFDCRNIPFPNQSFDLVIANHVLFYCDDIPAVCREAARISASRWNLYLQYLRKTSHMQEISDARHINLTAVLYYPAMQSLRNSLDLKTVLLS